MYATLPSYWYPSAKKTNLYAITRRSKLILTHGQRSHGRRRAWSVTFSPSEHDNHPSRPRFCVPVLVRKVPVSVQTYTSSWLNLIAKEASPLQVKKKKKSWEASKELAIKACAPAPIATLYIDITRQARWWSRVFWLGLRWRRESLAPELSLGPLWHEGMCGRPPHPGRRTHGRSHISAPPHAQNICFRLSSRFAPSVWPDGHALGFRRPLCNGVWCARSVNGFWQMPSVFLLTQLLLPSFRFDSARCWDQPNGSVRLPDSSRRFLDSGRASFHVAHRAHCVRRASIERAS